MKNIFQRIDEIVNLAQSFPKFDGKVDWEGTNHYEMSGIDADGKYDPWLVNLQWAVDPEHCKAIFSEEMPCESEEGKTLGKVMEMAALVPELLRIIIKLKSYMACENLKQLYAQIDAMEAWQSVCVEEHIKLDKLLRQYDHTLPEHYGTLADGVNKVIKTIRKTKGWTFPEYNERDGRIENLPQLEASILFQTTSGYYTGYLIHDPCPVEGGTSVAVECYSCSSGGLGVEEIIAWKYLSEV